MTTRADLGREAVNAPRPQGSSPGGHRFLRSFADGHQASPASWFCNRKIRKPSYFRLLKGN